MASSYTPLFVGSKHIHKPQVDSTNAYLLEMVSKSRPPEGIVVSADYQTAGRGQIGREWSSEAGENILMSVLFYPTFLTPDQMFYLNIVASLAVHALVEDQLPKAVVNIKWPNDVYCNGRKVCGILIQNSIEHKHLKNAILGIGININQSYFEMDNATSLLKESGKKQDIRKLLSALMAYLEQYYLILKSNNRANLREAYMGSLYLKGEHAQYMDIESQQKFHGTIQGIDNLGNLRMRVGDEIKTIRMNEIRYMYEER